MVPDQPTTVPAGWYPDPRGVGELRWWDGRDWTDSVHPPVAPPIVEPPVVPPAAEPAAEPGVESAEAPDPGLDFPPPPMSPPDDDEGMKAPLRVYDLDDISPDPVVIAPVEAEPVIAAPVTESTITEPIAAEPAVDPAPEVAESAPVAAPAEPSASLAAPVFSDPIVPVPDVPVPDVPVPDAPVPDAPVPDVPVPGVPDPDVPVPGVPDPDAPDPDAQDAEPEPPAVYPDSFPSRRELRERGGASATSEPVTSEPVPDTSTPTSFDWLPSAATTPEPVTATPAAPASAVPPSAAPVSEVLAADPVTAVPVAAAAEAPTSAWSAEPGPPELDPEEPYGKPPTRMSTTSGWFIALMPLFAGILSVGAVKGAENYPRYLPFEWWALVGGVVVVLYLVTLLLAAADRKKLDEDGHAYPAHWAWAFLTAPVYLIARTLAVKRETGRTSVLLWVWLVLAALLVGGYFLTDYLAPGLLAAYTLPFL